MAAQNLGVMTAPLSLERDDTEARWIRESLAGDQDAFAALVRRHQGRVFRLAGRFFRRPEEVEEIAQETFLRAWTKLETYRAEAPFEHWLTRLCLRCAFDRLRRSPVKHEALPAREIESETPDPTSRLEVRGLLRRLSPADRFILMLLDGEGWPVAEIAARLGWTQVNVKVRAHRARKRLRRLLEEG